jgi:hypothetical protein
VDRHAAPIGLRLRVPVQHLRLRGTAAGTDLQPGTERPEMAVALARPTTSIS